MSERVLSAARAWLQAGQELVQALADAEPADSPAGGKIPPTWREKLWTVPPETRIGVAELCEATGRTKSWVYRNTSEKATGPRLPHRLMGGELVFVVGELRQWLVEQETTVVAGRTTSLVVQRSRRAS